MRSPFLTGLRLRTPDRDDTSSATVNAVYMVPLFPHTCVIYACIDDTVDYTQCIIIMVAL